MERKKSRDPRSTKRTYECDNCHHRGNRETFRPAKKVGTRIDPGGTYTDKECPRCGALAYPVENEGSNVFSAAKTEEDIEIGEDDFIVRRLEVHEQPVVVRAEEAEGPKEAARIVRDGGGTVLLGSMTYHTDLLEYGGVEVYHGVEKNGELIENVPMGEI